MALRNPNHKDSNVLRGGPQVPEEHALCQEAQQERPEEDAGRQHQGHECTCGYQGPCKAQGGQAQDPKGWHLPSRCIYFVH